MRRLLHLPVLLTLLTLQGCASAAERFEGGLALESEGRNMEAALRYLDALSRDPELPGARDGLRRSGEAAIQEAHDRSAVQADAGAPAEGAATLLGADDVVRRAGRLGIELPVPRDYGDRRRDVFDQAIEAAMTRATAARTERAWATAVAAFEEVLDLYEPEPALAEELRDRRAVVLVDWAAQELEAGRYRTAWETAGRVLERSVSADRVEEAEGLRNQALELGTVYVAIFPITVSGPGGDGMASSAALELSDALELDYWSDPPLFIQVLDVTEVRRLVRARSPEEPWLSDPQVAALMRELGADVGVVIDLNELGDREVDVRRDVRTATAQNGRTLNWTREQGRIQTSIQATWGILYSPGRSIEERTVRTAASDRFERGVFDGNPDRLDLSRSERQLFDPDVARTRRQAVRSEAIAELADRLASQIYDRIGRTIR